MTKGNGITMFLITLFMSMIFVARPVQVQAAVRNITLEKDTTYKYNLDGKGAKEEIKYTVKQGELVDEEKYQYTVKLYVNGECFYNEKLTAWSKIPVRVMVTDTDSSDGTMELLILEGENLYYAWSSEIEHIRYYKYASGKLTYVQDLASLFEKGYESNVYMLHGMSDKTGKFLKMDGKGTIKARLCLQFADDEYRHIVRAITLKSGRFTVKETADNECLDVEYNDFKTTKQIKIYEKAGGKKVSAIIKKNKTGIVTGIYRTDSGKLYYKVKYNEKSGYILPSTLLKNSYAIGCLHV